MTEIRRMHLFILSKVSSYANGIMIFQTEEHVFKLYFDVDTTLCRPII